MVNPTSFGPPEHLDFEKGLMFFHAYMYGPLQGKLRLYRARDVSPTTVASPSDWEVFASILVGDPGTSSQAGVDLVGYEVKSARDRSSFEYQYHRDSWESKFDSDAIVGHLFFMHRDNLKSVRLFYAPGPELNPDHFAPWRADCPYPVNPNAQRYRKTVPYGWVRKNGLLLMELVEGEVAYPPDAVF